MRKWLNILVIAIPLTIAAWVANGSGTYAGKLTEAIFILALVAVIPLASLLGGLTESLEVYFGDKLGGLLGASFANVPELAIGIGLLVHAQIHKTDTLIVTSDMQVIRGLLIGSVINNILFVLGSSIFLRLCAMAGCASVPTVPQATRPCWRSHWWVLRFQL